MSESYISDNQSSEKIIEVQHKRKPGRPRKYACVQDRINAIAKKQCEDKKLATRIRHALRDDHHDSPMFLLQLLSTQVIDDSIADAMFAIYQSLKKD